MPYVTGTCMEMCPMDEIRFRQRNALLHPFECHDPSLASANLVPDPTKMVKEYTRSAAGTDHLVASRLRPFPVLTRTVAYLLELFEEKRSNSFEAAYVFIMDRLRACRQDMIMQRLPSQEVVHLMESMIPFYLETNYICKVRSLKSYDVKLHSTQLEECFSRWAECADVCEINADVGAAFVLSHSDDMSILRDFLPLLPGTLRMIVTQLLLTRLSGNYIRFFRLLEKLPKVARFALSDIILDVRRRALQTISIAYKTPTSKLPVSILEKWLSATSFKNGAAPAEDWILVGSLNSESFCEKNMRICKCLGC